MTREEVMSLLNELNLSSSMDDYDVRHRLSHLGYDSKIKVYDGATKICLVFCDETDFIVKWSYNCDDDTSESIKECNIYNDAVEAGLEMFFPKTEILGKYNDVTVIIQDKIDYSANNCPINKKHLYRRIGKTVTYRIYEKMQKGFKIEGCGYNRTLNNVWAYLVISLYGKKVSKKLCDFIQEHKINDLHEGNIGYKNDKPIILDFSGYHR